MNENDPELCPDCEGTGDNEEDHYAVPSSLWDCKTCGGTGNKPKEEEQC